MLSLLVTSLVAMSASPDPPTIHPPPPLLPTPSERQMKWHDRGMYAFVHFNMNTFTDHEWGDGREDPGTFNPSALDTDQWCRVFKDAGMTGVIITAKHHDGFCLWPSAYTEHSVRNSPWRDGKGDLLAELSASCRRHGLDLGVYLSPWDRNNPLYGTGEKYNVYFANQLRETLENYGPIFEVWFDGACGEGPNGKRQVYDFPMFHDVVRDAQPDACIFSDAGPDVRWIGNERGYAGETNWSMLSRDEFYPGIPGRNTELNHGQENGTHWLPGEVDVSIRPGWYYHESQDDQVKDLDALLDIWYWSIGRNANLLLNFPVDRRGLVHEHDVAAVMQLRNAIDNITREDVALGRQIEASNTRGDSDLFHPRNAVDGDPATYWATDDDMTTASLEIRLDGPTPVNHVDLGEHLPLGQRVRMFSVQARTVDGWTPVAKGTTIGNRRILRFPTVMASRMRVVIEDSRAAPTLRHVRVFSAPPGIEIAADSALFVDQTEAYLVPDRESAIIHYTLDGTEPTTESPRHVGGPIRIDDSTVLKA
ncbi:MAG: alpha-L-fucosidase, partial [Phycisphaerales bacterium]|nr:alpha-L-fucosidase [Phycisphaerales bacterium]